MNLRPSGYEPDELPDCSTPRYSIILYAVIVNFITEWMEMDSNHRSVSQQIYSLPPLATREPIHIFINDASR